MHHIEPEYAESLDRVFFVYGQVQSLYQFPEIAEICGHLPPRAKIYVLASKEESDVARRRFDAFGIPAEIVHVPDDAAWHWGRDVGQVGWPERQRTFLVPWTKTAGPGEDLVHQARTLNPLRAFGVRLRQAPLSFEGGNCLLDDVDGRKTLFVGNTAVLETIALYRGWLGKTLTVAEAREHFKRSFGVDDVVMLGRTAEGKPLPQAGPCFHIDMVVAVPARGVAVVQAFDSGAASEKALCEDIGRELEASVGDEAGRQALKELAKKNGVEAKIPKDAAEREAHAHAVAAAEFTALREAEAECRAVAKTFKTLGYRVVTLETDWRRVRRHQAASNIIPSRDRLLMPLFPDRESLFAYTLPLPNGRRIASLRARPGKQEYRLAGVNRRAYELYSKLVPNVRTVRDRFYVTGGNLHCVMGRF